MQGELKNKKRMSLALPFDTIDKLKKHKQLTDVPTSVTVNKALTEYLDRELTRLEQE